MGESNSYTMRSHLVVYFSVLKTGLDTVQAAVANRCTDGQIGYQDDYQMYCDSCPKGYYCLSGEAIECGPGNYCPTAAAMPTPCPLGTVMPNSTASDLSECEVCRRGFYCGWQGLAEPTGVCGAGYYCPPRSLIKNSIACPAGYFCPEGAQKPTRCPSGSYNSLMTRAECKTCPAGFYCNENVIGTLPLLCPIGRKCPEGSGEPLVCPSGSYHIKMGQSSCPGEEAEVEAF